MSNTNIAFAVLAVLFCVYMVMATLRSREVGSRTRPDHRPWNYALPIGGKLEIVSQRERTNRGQSDAPVPEPCDGEEPLWMPFSY